MSFIFLSLAFADWISTGATFSTLSADYSIIGGDTTTISGEGAIFAKAFVSKTFAPIKVGLTLRTSVGSLEIKGSSALELSLKRSGFSASTKIFIEGCSPWNSTSAGRYWGQSISANINQRFGSKTISLRLHETGRNYSNSIGTHSSFQRVTSDVEYSFPLRENFNCDIGIRFAQHTVPDTETASYNASELNFDFNRLSYSGWSEVRFSLSRQDGAHPDGINSYWQMELFGKHSLELNSVFAIIPQSQIFCRKHDKEENPYYNYIWAELSTSFLMEMNILTLESGPIIRKQWASLSFPSEEFWEPALKCELMIITLSGGYANFSTEFGWRTLKMDTVNLFGNYSFANLSATILWPIFEKTHIEIVGFWSPEWHKTPGENFAATYIWCSVKREF